MNIQMMAHLGKYASIVQLGCLDVTKFGNENKAKQQNLFHEVEQDMEKLFASNSSLSEVNTSESASKNQILSIDKNIITISSDSEEDEPNFSRDDMTIKQFKGKKKSKQVCKPVSLTQEIIEPLRLFCLETIDLTIETIDDEHENNSSNKLSVSTNPKTIPIEVSTSKKDNKTAKRISSNTSNKKSNLSHRASTSNKRSITVDCKKDSQKSDSIKVSTKKNDSPHSASTTNKCHNTDDCKNTAQNCNNLLKMIANNDTKMDIHGNIVEEPNINKSTCIQRVFKKKLNEVQILSSIENSTDLTENPITNTKSGVNSPHSKIETMKFAIGTNYEMLRIITFQHFSFYNKNSLYKLANIFIESNLLLKSYISWHPDTVQLIKILLEDIYKLLKRLEFNKIVLMASLSVLYRRIYFSDKSEEMYRHFKVFINIIETCTMGVDDRFWKPLLPGGWNEIFLYGCFIVDYILYGAMPNSMYLNVDWDAMPDINVLYNSYLNKVPSKNVLISTSTESKQPEIDGSAGPLDLTTLKKITDNYEDPNDISFVASTLKTKTTSATIVNELDSAGSHSERPVAIESSSISGSSCVETFTVTWNNDKENKKRKHSELLTNAEKQRVVKRISSHYTVQQLHAQNMCLQIPKFSKIIQDSSEIHSI